MTLPCGQLWKDPVTGELQYQIHPSAVHEFVIDPVPSGEPRPEDARYPDGAHITDLTCKTARDILYELQRPSVLPEVCGPNYGYVC